MQTVVAVVEPGLVGFGSPEMMSLRIRSGMWAQEAGVTPAARGVVAMTVEAAIIATIRQTISREITIRSLVLLKSGLCSILDRPACRSKTRRRR